jgi:hypothetical protein
MESTEKPEPRVIFYQRFKGIELIIFSLNTVLLALRLSGLHIVGTAIFLILSAGSEAILSFLFAYSDNLIYDIKSRALLRIGNLASSVLTLGILFCVQFWPGGGLMLKVGGVLSLFSLIWTAAALKKQVVNFENFYNKALLAKLLFFTLLATCLMFTPPVELYKRVSIHGSDPVAVRLYKAHIKDPENEEKSEAFYQYVRSKDKK